MVGGWGGVGVGVHAWDKGVGFSNLYLLNPLLSSLLHPYYKVGVQAATSTGIRDGVPGKGAWALLGRLM